MRLILTLILIFIFTSALARDNGQYSQVKPEIRDWVRGLHDQRGVSCCDTADGQALEESEWDVDGDHYKVKINDQWWPVPESAMINEPNKLGHAAVWWYPSWQDGVVVPVIRCFIRGAMS